MGNSEAKYEKDKVILHQIGRGWHAPSFVPFAIKLETYLRMAEIPYENVHGLKKSPKGKHPWIEYNHEALGDSALIIKYLNEKKGVNLNSHLSDVQLAEARAMQIMTEEHLYWTMMLARWVYDEKKVNLKKSFGNLKFMVGFIARDLNKQIKGQGMGLHSYDEVMQIMDRSLKALSTYLGTKPFIMGDTPCEADCAIFGQLCQFRWQIEGQHGEKLVTETYPNLREYCDRMKGKYWPDWDDCNTKGYTVEAKK